jgi:predicted XRE-type DNA-binding protein
MMKEKIIASSGNVFEDLGFESAEASVLAMRSALMNDLRRYIENIIANPNRSG